MTKYFHWERYRDFVWSLLLELDHLARYTFHERNNIEYNNTSMDSLKRWVIKKTMTKITN